MEYKIIGEPMPVVECQLGTGEAMKTEAGSMTWMSPNTKMATNTGGGGLGKIILQTMTLAGFAGALRPFVEKGNN